MRRSDRAACLSFRLRTSPGSHRESPPASIRQNACAARIRCRILSHFPKLRGARALESAMNVDRNHRNHGLLFTVFATLAACSGSDRVTPPAAQGLSKVNHIIVVMMENHSFDNYFGALPYVPGGPY